MKTFIVIIGLVLVVYFITDRRKSSHGPGAAHYMPEPSPALSNLEAERDRPSDDAFNRAGWKTVDRATAEAFGITDNNVHCDMAWRQAVSEMPARAQVRASRALGRQGLCTWYVMRIVGPDGNVMCEFQRPGPRGSKPSDY